MFYLLKVSCIGEHFKKEGLLPRAAPTQSATMALRIRSTGETIVATPNAILICLYSTKLLNI